VRIKLTCGTREAGRPRAQFRIVQIATVVMSFSYTRLGIFFILIAIMFKVLPKKKIAALTVTWMKLRWRALK
jgi:hypothetical protein